MSRLPVVIRVHSPEGAAQDSGRRAAPASNGVQDSAVVRATRADDTAAAVAALQRAITSRNSMCRERAIEDLSRGIAALEYSQESLESHQRSPQSPKSPVTVEAAKPTELTWRDGCRFIDTRQSGLVMVLHKRIGKADRWIKRIPTDPKGYLMKGSALVVLNRWEDARIAYSTGIVHCKGNDTALRKALIDLNGLEETICLSAHAPPPPKSPVKKTTSFELGGSPKKTRAVGRTVSLDVGRTSARGGSKKAAESSPLADPYSSLLRKLRRISPSLRRKPTKETVKPVQA